MRITAKLIELIEKIKIVIKLAEFWLIFEIVAKPAEFLISALFARSAIWNLAGTFQICRWLRVIYIKIYRNIITLKASVIIALNNYITIIVKYDII